MTPDATIIRTVRELRRRAWQDLNYGSGGDTPNLQRCRGTHVHKTPPLAVSVILTRDAGMHRSGWWKNPDYDRCWHLSLAFFEVDGFLASEAAYRRGDAPAAIKLFAEASRPQHRELAEAWVRACFDDHINKVWCEPPAFREGKRLDTWHYRLFCDVHWQPLKPRGEVYSRDFTEAGWKSWSDVQAERAAVAAGLVLP